jgi:hypothetical protein
MEKKQMSGTVYCIDIPSTAVTTTFDFVEITPADDRPVCIVMISLFQTTELGDAAEEILPIQIIRGHTTSGNGTAATPRPQKRNAVAAGCTAEVAGATIASTGTTHVLLTDGWNVRVPYLFQPIHDDQYPQATQGDTTMVVRLAAAPADSITVRGCIWIMEEA